MDMAVTFCGRVFHTLIFADILAIDHIDGQRSLCLKVNSFIFQEANYISSESQEVV